MNFQLNGLAVWLYRPTKPSRVAESCPRLAKSLGVTTFFWMTEKKISIWRWLLTYRRRSRPPLRQAIAAHASGADIQVLPNPRAVRRFVARITSEAQVPP